MRIEDVMIDERVPVMDKRMSAVNEVVSMRVAAEMAVARKDAHARAGERVVPPSRSRLEREAGSEGQPEHKAAAEAFHGGVLLPKRAHRHI
jgi:hypothetical protein